jgi:2-polyprenyl-6-hydroxyphenyl methylase/3-demethylubiquinone-9 3-methyltransferase
MLEHLDDVHATVGEVARVLRPGGLYVFDTINRTVRSDLPFIKVFQEWRATAFIGAEPPRPRDVHHAQRDGRDPHGRRPAAGADGRDRARRRPPRALLLARARARGRMTYGDFGRALKSAESRDKSGLYAGTAVKPG